MSRARRQFEALAPGFHAAASLARAWRQAEIDTGNLARRELAPLQQAYDQRLKQLVLMLDARYADPELDESDRHTLSTYLVEATLDLLEHEDDPEIGAIFDRHDDILDDIEDDRHHDMTPAEFQEYVKDNYGEDIDDDIEPGSPEAARLLDYLQQEKSELDEARQHKLSAELEKRNIEGKRHEAELAQALDELILELGNMKAGEGMDELLQQATAATAQRDLARLIEIRLELERRGIAGHVSEKKLATYNKVIKEEVQTLELEISWHESELRNDLPDIAPGPLTPPLLLQELNKHIGETREMVAEIDEELTALQDVHKLKAWLRRSDEPGGPEAGGSHG